MTQADHSATIVVVVSDPHCNSTTGLRVPEFRLKDGSTHLANPAQIHDLWEPWLTLWDQVKARAKRLQARIVVVLNGDGPDRNRHSGGYELITMARDDIVRLTVATLRPAREAADTLIVNRGTDAHEGGTGELAELVAKELDALPDPQTGCHSWYWPELEINGLLCLFGHHPISNSTRQHLRGSGALRTAAELTAAYQRMGDRVPKIAVFSHVHHHEDSGLNFPIRVLFTPPWKLIDGYGYRLGRGSHFEPVGAWLIHIQRGLCYPELWTHQPARQAPVVI